MGEYNLRGILRVAGFVLHKTFFYQTATYKYDFAILKYLISPNIAR